ncbi:MAG: NAD(P)/FAD-dependent oxidoreductase [Candidatus Hydrogenedentes bacterium]|nr:NAD(P)/FAD-dependent oxidoreductase [Candidatus Hydrogenedentota bacterium]
MGSSAQIARKKTAVVIGAGPNGLAAACTLAHAGMRVTVLEQHTSAGGGARTAELIEPGVLHDVCATSLPLAVSSPCFQDLDLEQCGVRWVHPTYPMAHPFLDGTAAVLSRDIGETAESFRDTHDANTYSRLMTPLVQRWPDLIGQILSPLRIPRHPFLLARFGLSAIRSGLSLAHLFKGGRARGFIAGLAAHSGLPLDQSPAAAFALVLAAAGHAVGWPFVEGGTQQLVEALAARLIEYGGSITTGCPVSDARDLPPADVYLFDVTPRQLLQFAGDLLPQSYRRRLARYRYGPGVFKMDWVLSAPVPWAAGKCRNAGVIHLGGNLEDIRESEREPHQGRIADQPFLLLAQPTLFDPSRAPAGRHVLWGYCHVPNASTENVRDAVERQIERFAPGFSHVVVGRASMNCQHLEQYNPNLVGGDIGAGLYNWTQLFTRPVARLVPWATPNPRVFICSASTPPAGGVHGMCGCNAARAALNALNRL